MYSTCTISPRENERQIEALLHRHPELTAADRPVVQTLPHRDRTDGFFIATFVEDMNDAPGSGQPAQDADEMFGPDRMCPSCSEPWLRPTQLAGRYRCVNCLVRFQLMAYCPSCGEHSTMVRVQRQPGHGLRALRRFDAEAGIGS